MHYGYCGGYCEPEAEVLTKADKKALLEEKKVILEAKLATIKHLLETVDKEEKE